jgi:hypothetical protein
MPETANLVFIANGAILRKGSPEVLNIGTKGGENWELIPDTGHLRTLLTSGHALGEFFLFEFFFRLRGGGYSLFLCIYLPSSTGAGVFQLDGTTGLTGALIQYA